MMHMVIPFGTEGWERKRRFFEEIISSRSAPPFVYDDILVLVPSSRLKRAYGKLFLEIVEGTHGSPALVPPQVQTLHQFLHHVGTTVARRLLLEENSRLVLLEGIVKRHLAGQAVIGRNVDVLAPSLSAAMANIIEELSASGVTPDRLSAAVRQTDFSEKPQVRLLTGVYATYERLLSEKGLTDPSGMFASLADHFDPAWISAYSTIIIDGIHDADEFQTRILRQMADTKRCTFLINAPSAESITSAGDHHPLRLAKELLTRLASSPGDDAGETHPDDRFLAGVLFSDRPFDEAAEKAPMPSSFRKDIRLFSAVNAREEVSLIAGNVKKSLKNGTPPDSILVAFPSLDEYGPLAEEIFRDYGIPYNRALGRQLSTSPVSAALISVLRACQEDFAGPSLLRIFSSPFLKFSETPASGPALDRLMRKTRVTGGKDRLVSAMRFHSAGEGGTDVLTGQLNDLFTALAPFTSQQPAPLSAWMERFAGLMAWSGIDSRVSLIKGPLNINLQAYKKLTETLSSLDSAGRLFPEYTYTFNEWFFLLKKTFMHTRFQVPPEDEGGVQILGLHESMGHLWNEIYLGGFIDGTFPQRLPQNIFLPEATLETLGVRTLERARLNAALHFYRLLLSAQTVTITWPENEGDRPVVPSPFLAELTPLTKAGLVNRGMETVSGIQFNLRIEESRSIPELSKAISLAGTPAGIEELLSSDSGGLAAVKAACVFNPPEPATAVPAPRDREFRVTELDLYIQCPYDYYVKRVLDIEPLEEVTEDISPLERGSKVHAILRAFYESWDKTVTRENRNKARALLKTFADSAFGSEADTFRNRREKELFLTIMVERFLDAEEDFWKQGMRPAYLEQKIDLFNLPLSDGTEVKLMARIDRIDIDEHGNFIIVDYKTGGYPPPQMNIEQDIFQLPVYAVMAQQALSGDAGARNALGNEGARRAVPLLKKPIGLAYYDLSGKYKGPARDVVLYNKEARSDHPATKPKASPKNAEDFETILKQSMDKARTAVEGILSGDFTTTPRDENRCRYCANEIICGKKNEK